MALPSGPRIHGYQDACLFSKDRPLSKDFMQFQALCESRYNVSYEKSNAGMLDPGEEPPFGLNVCDPVLI